MEEKLIESVKQYKILFDKTEKEYRRTDLKNKIWKNIAREMNLTEDEVRRRWRTLKDRYFRERREMYAASGSSRIVKKPWKYMELMSFLTDAPTSNEFTSGNYGNRIEEEVLEDNFIIEESEIEESSHTSDTRDDEEGTSSNSLPSVQIPATTPRKKRSLRDSTLIENTHKEMTELLKIAKDSFRNTNPITAFFNSMACLVTSSNLSVENTALLQTKVVNVVHEIVLKQAEENKNSLD